MISKKISSFARMFPGKNKSISLAGTFLVLTRLLSWLSNPQGTTHPDSSTYIPLHWGDLSQVSITGHAQRNWVVPLMYSLLPNNSTRILAQLIIGAVAWILTIKFINSKYGSTKLYNPVIILITVIGCSPNVVQFETALLATATIMYLLLIYLLGALYLVDQKQSSFITLFWFIILGWLTLSVKGSNLVIALSLLVYVLFNSMYKISRYQLAILSLLAAALVIQSGLMNIQNDKQQRYSYSSFTMLWHLGAQSPTASGLAKYLESSGAPSCLTQEAPFSDVTKSISSIQKNCPDATNYLKLQYKKDVFRFLMMNPSYALKNTTTGLAIAFTSTSSNYGSTASILPPAARSLIFGGVTPDFRTSGASDQSALGIKLEDREPLWIFMPGAVLVFFPIAMRFKGLKGTSNGRLILFAHLLLVTEMAMTITILPSEWFRQNIQYLICLYLLGALASLFTENENAEKSKA